MPIASRLPQNPCPLPAQYRAANQSSFALQIAAYNYATSLPCPDDGKIYPPAPKRSVVNRISARLHREERNRKQRAWELEYFGAEPPKAKGGA